MGGTAGGAGGSSRRGVVRHARRLARTVVAGTVGHLPFFEYRLELTRWRATRALQRREDDAVATLTARLGRLPTAELVTIIPTYRRPELLRAAVASALEQGVEDHHVLVVDDGGGITAPLPTHQRLTVVQLPANLGAAGVVRNVGIRLSRSRLIAFLDDDNTWEPDHLEVAVAGHARGAELTYSGIRRVDGRGRDIDVLGEVFDRRAMRERSLVDTNAIVVRRGDDVRFSRVPRRRGDFPLEDWELVWRLSRRLHVQHLPDITVRYVCHEGSNFSEWGVGGEDS